MIVQFYVHDSSEAAIFEVHEKIASLPDCFDLSAVDKKLKQLGLCRRGKWEKADFGFEANLRRCRP